MTYPFVAAAFDYGPRRVAVRAFLVHMAEGGGTVGYLAGSPARGVSVHYVIEYGGRVVQMLSEGHVSGSVNPSALRTTDDADGFYGVTAARKVMGPQWADPNPGVISVEIEGFARDGPDPKQAAALVALVDDVRSRHPGFGLLGHRDFTDQKACPGQHIAWDDLGGHGGSSPMGISVTLPAAAEIGRLAVAGGTEALRLSDGAHVTLTTASVRQAIPASLTGDHSGPGFLVDAGADELHFVRASSGAAYTPPPPPVVDCDDVVTRELAAAADRAAVAVRTR